MSVAVGQRGQGVDDEVVAFHGGAGGSALFRFGPVDVGEGGSCGYGGEFERLDEEWLVHREVAGEHSRGVQPAGAG